MAVPLRQNLTLAAYLASQRIKGRDRFPLIVELEPLFACNLACAGCGKIQYPAHVLKRRMPVDQAVAAVEESGRMASRWAACQLQRRESLASSPTADPRGHSSTEMSIHCETACLQSQIENPE